MKSTSKRDAVGGAATAQALVDHAAASAGRAAGRRCAPTSDPMIDVIGLMTQLKISLRQISTLDVRRETRPSSPHAGQQFGDAPGCAAPLSISV